MGRVFGLLLTFLSFILLVGIIISYLPRLEFVQKKLATEIVSTLKDQLLADFSIGYIKVNGLSGIQMDEILIRDKHDTIAYIPRLTLQYNLRKVISRRINVDKLILEDPVIKVLRNKQDSIWNVVGMIKASEDTTTSSERPNLKIDLRKLEIQNGRAYVIDSLSMRDTLDGSLDYANLQVDDLNIDIAALLDLKKNRFRFGVKELKLLETNTALDLQHTDGEITLTDKSIELDGFELLLNNSEVDINVVMGNFSVLNPDLMDYSKATFDADMRALDFHPDLVKKFADPQVDISGTLNIIFNGEGSFEHFEISKLEFEHNETVIKLNGEINEILDPEKLNVKVKVNNSYADVEELYSWAPFLKDLPIPVVKKVGINSLNAFYKWEYAEAEMDVQTDIGVVKGFVSADFGKNDIYKSDIEFTNLNIGKLNENIDYNSKLNGYLKAEIKGLDPFNMEGNVDLFVKNSRINGRKLDTLDIKFDLTNKIYSPLKIKLRSSESGDFDLSGEMDLRKERIEYAFDLQMNKLDPDELLQIESPKDITGKLKLKGNSIDPDDLVSDLDLELSNIQIDTNQIKDISVKINIDHSKKEKKIKLRSDFVDLDLNGYYTIDKISEYSVELINNIPNVVFKDSLTTNYPDLSLSAKGKFKSIDKIMALTALDDLRLKNSFTIDLISDSLTNYVNLTGLEFYKTHINFGGTEIDLDSTFIDGKFNVNEMDVSSLRIRSKELVIDGNKINNIDLKADYLGNTLSHNIKLNYNNEVDLFVDGNTAIINGNYNLIIDSLFTSYQKNIELVNQDKLLLFIDSASIDITKADLMLNNQEQLQLSGLYYLAGDEIGDINLKFSEMNMSDLEQYLQIEESSIETLKGNLKYLKVNISGTYDDPNFSIGLQLDSLELNSMKVGDLSTDIFYFDKNVYGIVEIIDQNYPLFTIDIERFPIEIDLKNGVNIPEEECSITIISEELPIQAFDPFVPGISRLTGKMNSFIQIEGKAENGFDYYGSIDLESVEFLADATNIKYEADSHIELEKGRLNILKTTVRNKKEDLKDGKANVNGWVAFNENGLGDMELNINSKKMLVLREETKYSMPDLYGEFVISTGTGKMVFDGTLDEPNLSGDIDILRADLKQPNKIISRMVRSELQYIRKDSLLKIQLNPEKELEVFGPERDFADLINYDLRIRFIGPFYLDSELNAATELFAEIGSENKGDVIRFIKYRDEQEADLTGKIIVKNNSVLVSLGKKFRTDGFVEFPTGEITNPGFNLTARYNNQTSEGVPFEVRILIGGTLENPEIRFDYTYNGETPSSNDQQEITQDAFSLIALNMLRSDAFSSSAGGLGGDDLSQYGNTLISSLASQSLSDALGINAEVDLDINNPDAATVKLKGELFENINWTVGGNISDLNNNEITIEIPLALLQVEGYNIKLTKPNQVNNNVDQNQIQWEVSFGFKKKF